MVEHSPKILASEEKPTTTQYNNNNNMFFSVPFNFYTNQAPFPGVLCAVLRMRGTDRILKLFCCFFAEDKQHKQTGNKNESVHKQVSINM